MGLLQVGTLPRAVYHGRMPRRRLRRRFVLPQRPGRRV